MAFIRSEQDMVDPESGIRFIPGRVDKEGYQHFTLAHAADRIGVLIALGVHAGDSAPCQAWFLGAPVPKSGPVFGDYSRTDVETMIAEAFRLWWPGGAGVVFAD